MLERAKDIIKEVASQTDEILLMHSLSGKDSIVLLDLCAPYFKRIVCVYMYVVPNMEHMDAYYRYAKNKYSNVEFIQCPHYAYFNWVKYGNLGIEQNKSQKQYTLSSIIEKVKEKTGIEWCAIGFKQSDSLNRRLMLRSYKDGKESICYSTKKFYPLSVYKNKDVIEYIQKNHLKQSESYGGKGQSCGQDITSYYYLKYLEKNFPNDLEKVYKMYPMTQFIIKQVEHEMEVQNGRDKAE